MLRLTRLLAVPALALGLMAFQDASNKLTFDMPEGWTDAGVTAAGFHTFKAPDGMTGCAVKATEVPALASVTQADINTAFGAPFDTAMWANLLGADVTALESSAGEARDIGGKFLQIATLDLKAGFEGVPFASKARVGVIVVPGAVLIGTCNAKAEEFGTYEATFEKAVSSLRAL